MNVLIYPADYPAEGDPSFDLDAAVEILGTEARDDAIRSSHSRRISGQNASLIQGRLCGSKPFQMVLTQRGKTQQSPSQAILGTVAITANGLGYGQELQPSLLFYLQSESNALSGLSLAVPRVYVGSVNAPGFGYTAGGIQNILYSVMEETDFAKLARVAIGALLSYPRYAVAGFGNKTVGVFAGGGITGFYGTRAVNEFTFATKICADLGNRLTQSRIAPHNGAGNTTNAWVFGGVTAPGTSLTTIRSIDGYTYSSKLFALVGQSLTQAQQSHATFASTLKAYIAGGLGNSQELLTLITAFVFSGQTNSAIGETLAEPKFCCTGTGSSVAGYVLGGSYRTDQDINAAGSWASNTVDKVTYATEGVSRVGQTLAVAISDQVSVADYSNAWS